MSISRTILALLGAITTSSATSLNIITPNSLKSKFGSDGYIQAHLGHFGHINYGTEFNGRLHFPVSNRDACAEFVSSDFSNDQLFDEDTDMTPILLVEHGGCSHTQKTYNAQKAGLQAAVLIEDDAEDYYQLRTSQHQTTDDINLGYDLNIPYFKIFGIDGNKLKTHMKEDTKPVYISVNLGLSNPDNRVEYELWYSSILDLTQDSIKELGEYQKPFGVDTLFIPRIATFSCENCPRYIREKNCVSDGKYCPFRPKTHEEELHEVHPAFFKLDTDNDPKTHMLNNKVTDLELIMESLRSKCVNQFATSKQKEFVLLWYIYMISVGENALTQMNLKKGISENVMKKMSIPIETIDTCVNNSFEIPGDYQSDNKFLKEDRKWQRIMEVREHPAITINNHTYHGDFTGYDIAKALCASFKDRPSYCKQDKFETLKGADVDYSPVLKDTTTRDLLIAGAMIVFINVGMILILKKGQQKENKTEIQMEVNQAVASYFALRGEEPKDNKTNGDF